LEKVSLTDLVRNEGLQRVKEETNIVQTIKRRKGNPIGREDVKKDVSYQFALMKRQDTGN
jgi:hypothetical protein